MQRACGPVVMTLPSHGRNRRFKSGQAHCIIGDIDKTEKSLPFIYLNLNNKILTDLLLVF